MMRKSARFVKRCRAWRQIDLRLDYGLPAADARSNGVGTKAGLRMNIQRRVGRDIFRSLRRRGGFRHYVGVGGLLLHPVFERTGFGNLGRCAAGK